MFTGDEVPSTLNGTGEARGVGEQRVLEGRLRTLATDVDGKLREAEIGVDGADFERQLAVFRNLDASCVRGEDFDFRRNVGQHFDLMQDGGRRTSACGCFKSDDVGRILGS